MRKPHALTRLPQRSIDSVSLLLGSPARWTMLYELARHDLVSVTHLASTSGLSPSATSMHVRVMRKTGIIEQGLGRLYRLTPAYRPAPGQDYLDLGPCRLMLPPPG